ncbi:methyl-accepting chemotaxis protein [Capilliphycus salinus ALCB114379]|uniref:methyl-accepting chemotaxis protein n=1 Tax=Capilliphycus salinus TaxID=2768948 RepID=UPI0039A62B7B
MFTLKKLRYGLIGGYCIPILLIIIAAFFVTYNVKIVQKQQQRLNLSQEISEEIDHLTQESELMSSAVKSYLLDAQPIYIRDYRTAQQNYQIIEQTLEQLIEDERQRQSLEMLKEAVATKQELDRRLLELVNQDNSLDALQLWKQSQYLELSQEITTILNSLNTRENEIVESRVISQEQALNNLLWMIWIVTGISLLLALIFGGWIITQIIHKLEKEANAIATATTEIATTVAQQEQVAVQQAASVNQTTTSIDELGVSARQSAEQAAAAAESATQVLTLAGGNSRRNSQQWQEKTNLKVKMSQIQEQIIRLSENLNQIYNITNLVSDLANQTNILALNASVEAVRAGEQGKGFGVVASEIRKLADQSRTSAQKIGVLISDIQNATNATILVTEEGTKAVAEIGIAINEVTVNVQQISLNIKQQAIAIEQIVEAMNSLNLGVQETTNGFSQTLVSTQLLNQTATHLKEMV